MHIFKKAVTFVVLLINLGLHAQVQLDPCRKQHLDHIIQVLDTALAGELGTWDINGYGEPCYSNIDMYRISHVITSKLPTLKSKIAQAVKNHLAPEERGMVIDMLNNLKKMSSITPEELATIIRVSSDNDTTEKMFALLKQSYPYLNDTFFFFCIQTEEQLAALFKQLATVDFQDASLNFVKNFFFIDVIHLLPIFILGERDSSELVAMKGIFHFWREEFAAISTTGGDAERITTLLHITHMLSSELLDEIIGVMLKYAMEKK